MEEDLGKLIKKIHNTFESNFNKNMGKFEITHSQMDLLMYLITNKDKEINQKNIEDKFNLTNPTVTGLLNRLESKGFIKRTTSKKDARYKTISATEKAINMAKIMKKKANDMKSKLTENISKEDLGITYKTLSKILNNININNI